MLGISPARRIVGDQRGSTALGFGMLMPIMVALTAGVIEFGLLMFEQGRATEATRRAARIAAMEDSIGNLENIATAPVVCTSPSGGVICDTGAVETSATFDSMVDAMQLILPSIGAGHLKVVYRESGLGSAESGGIKPLVTVTLQSLDYSFKILHSVPGMPDKITLPVFETSQVAKGYNAP
jgi:hypothetical protein